MDEAPTGVCLQCADYVFGYQTFCSDRCGDAFDRDLRAEQQEEEWAWQE